MYDDLVKRLRYRAKRENDYYEHSGDIINEAADAIEKFIEIIQNHDFLESLIKPRWVSVTERLPENYTDVLIYYERNAWSDGAVEMTPQIPGQASFDAEEQEPAPILRIAK